MDLAKLHAIADDCSFDFANARLLADDDGFLGTGADLSPSTLLHAYRCGVFPWFNAGEPICWWSPNPRCVLAPSDFVPSKTLRRTAKKHGWIVSANHDFAAVIQACSERPETWITQEMQHAYTQLHKLGAAVSIEVWADEVGGTLIGGLYGVQIGALFCGESMFHTRTDASKIAFWSLTHFAQQADITLIDCQLPNPHLLSLGAVSCTKTRFLQQLDTLINTAAAELGKRCIHAAELL